MISNDDSVNAPKLYFILLTTCGQIEAVCKQIHGILTGCHKCSFSECRDHLNENDLLKNMSVLVLKTECVHQPFSDDDWKWWCSYNKAKHELPEGIKMGTISNVLSSLAALYLFLNFYRSIPFKQSKDVLDLGRWNMNDGPIQYDDNSSKLTKNKCRTNLFTLKCHFMESEE